MSSTKKRKIGETAKVLTRTTRCQLDLELQAFREFTNNNPSLPNHIFTIHQSLRADPKVAVLPYPSFHGFRMTRKLMRTGYVQIGESHLDVTGLEMHGVYYTLRELMDKMLDVQSFISTVDWYKRWRKTNGELPKEIKSIVLDYVVPLPFTVDSPFQAMLQ